jgi:hypothetical protein
MQLYAKQEKKVSFLKPGLMKWDDTLTDILIFVTEKYN